jgi:acyl-CoA synthetase (AMP-forming)/AMP-acid ligase II/acetyltransferase-like isoleucine patch superfamily enzyme/acyl carrier protein
MTLKSPDTPILAATRHLLQPNGSIVGRQVAAVVKERFPTFVSAFGTRPSTGASDGKDDDDHPKALNAAPVEPPVFTHPALASIDGRAPLTHQQVVDFCQNLGPALHARGIGRGDRVALVLPNGPELALALLAVAQWATAVPLNANGAVSELEADLQRCGARLVIGPGARQQSSTAAQAQVWDTQFYVPSAAGSSARQDWAQTFAFVPETAAKLGIAYTAIVPSETEAGVFALQDKDGLSSAAPRVSESFPGATTAWQEPNGHEDPALVLFTSGTTGNKKLVPHCMGDLLTAATTIALSWDLATTDVNCNLMPLFHVGGIVRQIFSPMVSGGCVICCPAFDPSIFWALLQHDVFTWYYAAPTMHQLILQLGKSEGFIVHVGGTGSTSSSSPHKLRMIANAAGGLLPTLAEEMRRTFGANVCSRRWILLAMHVRQPCPCVRRFGAHSFCCIFFSLQILPSYGMTECMPISSPPATYQLEKPGTSGVPVGPEVAILNTATGNSLPLGQEGPICVRGEPCFRGYGRMANADETAKVPEAFIAGGWFNTGDLGYMDDDGYLYITGRSKEVINRGGEIIAPLEVEEAVIQHPEVIACAAFSAPHDVLQEVVGLVVVTKRPRRLDLSSLHEFLGDKLANPKWPQCLVFMDGGLPKSHTNKLLRVKLGQRLGLPELSDNMTPLERTWESVCPPQGTSLDVSIASHPVKISALQVRDVLRSTLQKEPGQELSVEPHPSRPNALICFLVNINRRRAVDAALDLLDRYAVPSHFVESSPRESLSPSVSEPSLKDALTSILQGPSKTIEDPVVGAIQRMFTDMLQLDFLPAADKNFFHLGGSSMLASQLASKIRKKFSIACNGSEVFQHATAQDMAKLVRQRSDLLSATTEATQDSNSVDSSGPFDHGAPFASKRLPMHSGMLASILQLVPMFIIYPIWQVTRYLLFFRLLLWSIDNTPGSRDIGTFVVAYLVFHFTWVTITPLVFVAIKWIVIGRYRAGRYPIWSSYYLRWWFVDICRKIFLRGIWGSHDVLLNAYYKMLGANIGRGAKISPECTVAEFDLVTIGKYAAIEMGTVRGFGVDNGAMILGDVTVERNASVGWKSVVAPYTKVPRDCHLGPVTSSYNVGAGLASKHKRVNRRTFPEPNLMLQVLVGGPVTFLVNAVGQIPPLMVLFCMLQMKSADDQFETLGDLMKWLCEFERIPYYIGIRVARAVLTPFFYMAAAVMVKWTVIGKFIAGPRQTTSQWQLMRHWLAATLFSRKKVQSVTDLIGRHYELVSHLYRLLGAKVGKRVFWPGHQPVFSGEFDLLEIGDDVVFGSRSAILLSTADACTGVTLAAGSNVSDNCVVLPGAILGKNSVLGSNSICPEGWYLPEGSIWLGSKDCEPICLDKGPGDALVTQSGAMTSLESAGPLMASEIPRRDIPLCGDSSTIRPFGKAFYKRQASYFVWPLSFIVLFSFVSKMLVVMLHTLPLLGALHMAAALLYGWRMADRDYDHLPYDFSTVYTVWLFMYVWTNFARVCAWLAIELSAKWIFMGQRQPGAYNYDTSSYAQRWELYQLLGKVRKFSRLTFLEFFSGTPFLAAYFRWNGAKIGKDCCIYPSGADPFMPEPDLVEMGDRVVVDCASIVCHLNTRGSFELQKIILRDEVTLRTRSRVQSGVVVEEGAQLLEKSLAMTGEVIEARSVWQGCAASWWFQYSAKDDDSESDKDDAPIIATETTSLLRGGSGRV